MARRFIACHQTGPGESEVITDPSPRLDDATGTAETLATADGWADRSFEWLPGDREGVLVLWAKRPYRDDPPAGGRPVGNLKRTGYTVMEDPG